MIWDGMVVGCNNNYSCKLVVMVWLGVVRGYSSSNGIV